MAAWFSIPDGGSVAIAEASGFNAGRQSRLAILLDEIGVHVITRRRLNDFAQDHPECATSLDAWYRIVKHTDFSSFNDVRRTFPSADRVGKFTVFNIGGNKARLIVAIHYNRKKVYMRHVPTHAECDRGTWKE